MIVKALVSLNVLFGELRVISGRHIVSRAPRIGWNGVGRAGLTNWNARGFSWYVFRIYLVRCVRRPN